LIPSTTQGALSMDLDGEDSYFPNVRLKIKDLAHAIRRQIQLFCCFVKRVFSFLVFWLMYEIQSLVDLAHESQQQGGAAPINEG